MYFFDRILDDVTSDGEGTDYRWQVVHLQLKLFKVRTRQPKAIADRNDSLKSHEFISLEKHCRRQVGTDGQVFTDWACCLGQLDSDFI